MTAQRDWDTRWSRGLLVVGWLLLLAPARAQKVEREFRLPTEQVPSEILAYVRDSFPDAQRTRYYQDVGEDGTTTEAKFRVDRVAHSVEFDGEAEWLNTEIEIPVDDVPDVVWQASCARWTDDYERFRVVRVQDHRGRDGERYYEVEISVREDGSWLRYELALSPSGERLRQDKILLAPGHLDRW